MRIFTGRLLSAVLIIAIAVYGVSLIVDISQKSSLLITQWDFAPYYFGAKAHQLGLNPYQVDNLTVAAGSPVYYRFVYPPPSLWFFRVFTFFTYPDALQIWLFFKLILLAGLIFLWRKYFLPRDGLAFCCLFLLLAFDAAIYWDFKTGNVAILEQFLIWGAFVFLLKKKPLPFCLLILSASIFKLTPVLFLLLLPLTDIENRWKYFAGTAIALVAGTGIWYAIDTAMFDNYWACATAVAERADDFNYSSLAFSQDIVDSFRSMTGLPLSPWAPKAVYLGLVSLVLWFSAQAFRGTNSSRTISDRRLIILMSCVVYFLVAPRMKCYSCIIMLVPAYYIMIEQTTATARPFIFILLILTVHKPLPQYDFIKYYSMYYLLYMGWVVWILYLIHIRRKSRPHPEASGFNDAIASPHASDA